MAGQFHAIFSGKSLVVSLFSFFFQSLRGVHEVLPDTMVSLKHPSDENNFRQMVQLQKVYILQRVYLFVGFA